jgi:hypothetical protein
MLDFGLASSRFAHRVVEPWCSHSGIGLPRFVVVLHGASTSEMCLLLRALRSRYQYTLVRQLFDVVGRSSSEDA